MEREESITKATQLSNQKIKGPETPSARLSIKEWGFDPRTLRAALFDIDWDAIHRRNQKKNTRSAPTITVRIAAMSKIKGQ